MTSRGGGPQTLPVSRRSQVADRLFTGSSQRRLNTQNLQEDLRMERYATSIERAKKSTEHNHAFQKKIFMQKSERLNEVKEQLKLWSEREQEAAREAEQLAQLNRDQHVALLQQLAATQEEAVIVQEDPNKGVLPAGGGPMMEETLTKGYSVPPRRNSSETSGAPMPRRRISKGSEISMDSFIVGIQTSCRPSWDPVEPEEDGGTSPVKNYSGKASVLDRPSAASLVHPGSSLDQSPRRNSSTGSSVHSTPRRVSDSRVALSQPSLSRRMSATSFASFGAASSTGRSEGKRSHSTGDAPGVSTLESLSRRSSQQQLDVGDLKRLTQHVSTVKTDYVTDPSLMLEEEHKVYEFLQKTQPGGEDNQKDNNTANFPQKGKPRMSLVYTESTEKQLAQLFGTNILEDPQSNNGGAVPQDSTVPSDGFLQRISQIPISLPAVYLTQTRSAMVRPRNFEKEIENRKAALPVYNQFENLRYCRYLRIPMPFEKDRQEEGEGEGVDNTKEGQLRRRATRMAIRTVSASSKRLTTNYSMMSELVQNIQEAVVATGSDEAVQCTSPTASSHHSEEEND